MAYLMASGPEFGIDLGSAVKLFVIEIVETRHKMSQFEICKCNYVSSKFLSPNVWLKSGMCLLHPISGIVQQIHE